MKNTNYEKTDAAKGIKTRIAKKAADLLMKRGIEEQECVTLFTYEIKLPIDILLSQKEK